MPNLTNMTSQKCLCQPPPQMPNSKILT